MTITLDRAEFDKRCRDNGENPTEPFWEESWTALVEYERYLKQKHNGKNIRAMRTWQGVKSKGLVRSTECRVLTGRGDGFATLMMAGKRLSTDEHLVQKYPGYFSRRAVEKAKKRIAEWD